MKEKLKETSVILISTIKWSILATIIGIIVGTSTTIFLKVLNWSILNVNKINYYYLFLPLIFFLSSLIIKYLAPDAEGHGTEKIIQAVHQHSGKINAMVVPIKLITSVITVAFGGSAGKEGPCAQIGGGLASTFSDFLRLDDNDRKKLVICGISAGFASVFGTPIAGAIFGVEVLFIGSILYDVLLPSFIASIISYHFASIFGIKYFYHPLNFQLVFSEAFFIKIIIAGILFGIISSIMIESMRFFNKLSTKLKIWPPLKGIIGGLAIIVLTIIFSKQFLGLGIETILSALEGKDIPWYAFVVKIIFTGITLNFGGSGGVLTPIFFIGATSGNLISKILRLDPATASAIGLVGVLAGTTNTPIASSILSIELFGANIAPYSALVCVISFLITGHRSVYPSQIISIRKSASIHIETGKEIEMANPKIKLREKSIIKKSLDILKKSKFLKLF